jgi:hypothetical protein
LGQRLESLESARDVGSFGMKRLGPILKPRGNRKEALSEKKTKPSYLHPGLLIPFTLVLSVLFLPLSQDFVSSRSYGIRNMHTRMLDREEIPLFLDLKVTGEKTKLWTNIFSSRDLLTITFSFASVLAEFVTYVGDIAFEASLVHASNVNGNVQKTLTVGFDDYSFASVSFVIDSADYPYDLDFDYSKTAFSFLESSVSVFWLNSGLSEDPADTYVRTPITKDNFNSFFVFETKALNGGGRLLIRPQSVSPLADYAVTVTFEDGAEATLRRNGTYEKATSKILGNAIIGVKGNRDLYPGKTLL